ncbi:MAG: thioredoxin family protein [Pseudomonadota bacterium]
MPLFDNLAKTMIKSWNQTCDQKIHIKLILPEQFIKAKADQNMSGKKKADQFTAISDELQQLASNLVIEPVTDKKERPGFELTENIFFSAYPMEKELRPFLNALSCLNKVNKPDKEDLKLSKSIQNGLKQIKIPVKLKLYIALFCPHCPAMVETLVPLALYCNLIKLDIIDGSLFEHTAAVDDVMSAPCLILDDNFRWTGSVAAQEIVDMITDRDPSQLSVDTLQNIMEQGDASWITEQMILTQKIFDAFIQLLCHPTWSVRLGAMVVVEELAQDAPVLATRLCPLLIKEFDSKDLSVQGDILYALGEAGNESTRQWITKKSSSFSHPDLIDAAKDAIETIKTNHEE